MKRSKSNNISRFGAYKEREERNAIRNNKKGTRPKRYRGGSNNKETFYKVEIHTYWRIYNIVQQDKDRLFECVRDALSGWNPEAEDKIKEAFKSLTEADGQKRIPRTGGIAIFVEKIKREVKTTCNHIVRTYGQALQIIGDARLVGDYSIYEIKEISDSDKIEYQREYTAIIGNYFDTEKTPKTDDLEEFIELIERNYLEAKVHPMLLQDIRAYASAHSFTPWHETFRRNGLEIQVKHLPHIVIND